MAEPKGKEPNENRLRNLGRSPIKDKEPDTGRKEPIVLRDIAESPVYEEYEEEDIIRDLEEPLKRTA